MSWRDRIEMAVTLAAVAALAWLALCLIGCSSGTPNREDIRADNANDRAAEARITAAEIEAKAAHGQASAADAAAARARAKAQSESAAAEDARAAARRAEDEARTARERAAGIAAERDRLGWWWSAGGSAILVATAGVAAFGWWLGMSRITAGISIAGSASGGLALALGLSWSWLPWASAGVLVLLAAAVVVLLIRAGRDLSAHGERAALVDPASPRELDSAKLASASEQINRGTWIAVQRMRGRPVAKAAKALDALRARIAGVI